jgi:hypothetical protein
MGMVYYGDGHWSRVNIVNGVDPFNTFNAILIITGPELEAPNLFPRSKFTLPEVFRVTS